MKRGIVQIDLVNLSQGQVDWLKECGYRNNDILVVDDWYKDIKLTVNDKKISRRKAIALIGINDFTSGIARATFHSTAVRLTPDSKISVMFEKN